MQLLEEGAVGMWRTGSEDIWKRVLLNKKHLPRVVYVILDRLPGSDMMGQLTPKRSKRLHVQNVGDRPCKGICHDLRGINADTGLEMWILMIGLSSVLHRNLLGRRLKPSEQFVPKWCWLKRWVYHGSSSFRVIVVGVFFVFEHCSCMRGT